MKLRLLLAGAMLAVSLVASSASAAVTIDFEGLADDVLVNGYYSGGTDSNGTSGPNLGVGFSVFRTENPADTPPSTIGFNDGAVATANVAAGFLDLNFDYGFFSAGTVSVFSGLNGTGALLGSTVLAANITSRPGPFTAGSVAFAGTAMSFTLTGGAGQLGLDNIVLNAVPEPATWTMLIGGFGLLGAAARRQHRVGVRYA